MYKFPKDEDLQERGRLKYMSMGRRHLATVSHDDCTWTTTIAVVANRCPKKIRDKRNAPILSPTITRRNRSKDQSPPEHALRVPLALARSTCFWNICRKAGSPAHVRLPWHVGTR
eukprot:scaffold137_cov398-Prasinococcus_capsulatus_cf.AAC.56